MYTNTLRIFAVFSIFLFTQVLLSQTILQGTITDNGAEYMGNGAEPVVNALVTLIDQADNQNVFTEYTNEQGAYSIQISATGIENDFAIKPDRFQLLQNYPNPFNPSTIIVYEIPQPAHIRIDVHNVLGQKIKTLFDGYQEKLTGQVIWNGTNDLGQGVSAGVYIYSLHSKNVRINKKMLLLDGNHGNPDLALVKQNSIDTSEQINKQTSALYTVQVTGDNIETYEQQDVEIAGMTNLDVIVNRRVSDIDGNVYSTVKIGDQWWMAENLKVTHYRNGDAIPNITDDTEWSNVNTGAYCSFYNEISYALAFGFLYNWYAVHDAHHLAPEGWHMPTDEEWKELEMNLGMSQSSADSSGWRGTDEGAKLKNTSDWLSGGNGTNESGFSALPGGFRSDNGSFYNIYMNAFFWSYTEQNGDNAWERRLSSDYSRVDRYYMEKQDGCSVRLIRD